VELIERALNGGTPSREVAQHLAACPACRRSADEIAGNLAFVRELREHLGPDYAVPGQASTTDAELVAGYRLVRKLGRGGQGEVYEAIQKATSRRTAIKLVDVQQSDSRQRRFEREVELAASLRHPGIVSVLHCERVDHKRCALIMEYVDGLPIGEWASSIEFGHAAHGHREVVRIKLRALAAVCEAVHYAHSRGVVHRDLKPDNILVQPDGSVRIVDFGIAKRTDDPITVTPDGGFSGTLAYAAPEQISAGNDRIDVRTDLYSLGVLMYEILSGRRPFDSNKPIDLVIRDVLHTEPPPMGTLPPGRLAAGSDAEAVVAKAIAKRPENRYQSAAEMQEDIERLADGRPALARPAGTLTLIGVLVRRHRTVTLAGALAAALIVAIAVAMTWTSRELMSQRARLMESLSVSAIQRGRAESAAGRGARAEELIWPELIASGATLEDPHLLFTGKPLSIQAAWALTEHYARSPTVLHARMPPGTLPIRFESGNASLRLALPDGRERVVRLSDGSWIDSNPLSDPVPLVGDRITTSALHRVMRSSSHDCIVTVASSESVTIARSTLEGGNVWDFTPDGSRMLVVTPNAQVELWSVDPPARICPIGSNRFVSNRPAFSLNGDLVLWGDETGIRAWRSTDGKPTGAWLVPQPLQADAVAPMTRSVRTDARGSVLAAAFHSGVLLFDLGSTLVPPRQLLPVHRGAVASLELTPDGARVLSVGSDQVIRVWNTACGQEVAAFDHPGSDEGRPAFSADGGYIATCDARGLLRVVEIAESTWPQRLDGPRNTVHRVRFSPDGSLLAAASSDGAAYAWNARDRSRAWVLTGDKPLSALAFDTPGARLALAHHDGAIDIVDLPTLARRSLAQAPPFVTWIGFDPGGKTLAVLSGEPWCDLFDAATGAPVGRLSGHAGRVIDACFTRDGSTLFTVGADGTLIAWDFASRLERFRTKPLGIPTRAVALAPDGRTIATGSDDRAIRLWDAASGAPLDELHGCRQHLFELAFHPDGNVLFSCGRDADIQVWDVRSGREVAVLKCHRDLVMSLALSPTGNQLATAGADRLIAVWDFEPPVRSIAANAGPWLTARPASRIP